jgi:hypothetical protein
MENSSTIAILMKLFTTKIVANKRLGFLNKLKTLCIDGSIEVSSESSKDFNCSEKKATSDPDINAENIKRIKTKRSSIPTAFAAKKKELNINNGAGFKKSLI